MNSHESFLLLTKRTSIPCSHLIKLRSWIVDKKCITVMTVDSLHDMQKRKDINALHVLADSGLCWAVRYYSVTLLGLLSSTEPKHSIQTTRWPKGFPSATQFCWCDVKQFLLESLPLSFLSHSHLHYIKLYLIHILNLHKEGNPLHFEVNTVNKYKIKHKYKINYSFYLILKCCPQMVIKLPHT